MVYTKTTKFTKQWFRSTDKSCVAIVKLELDTETFSARCYGYYKGHFADMESAIAAVREGCHGYTPFGEEVEL